MDWDEIARRRQAGEISESEKDALRDMAWEEGHTTTPNAAVTTPDVQGVVYYIKTCCRIKIGFTTDMALRMRQLTPDEILATEPGTKVTERKRHKQFESARHRGEWFRETPGLVAHITAVRARHHSAETGFAGERMISTASATAWTGRTRQVLYRWAGEGRVTRYGSPTEAMWDIFELPPLGPGGIPGPPPPKRQ